MPSTSFLSPAQLIKLPALPRRASKKEKAFQAEQMALISAAARFDAREYVDRAIERAETMPMATRFGGKRLPYFIRLELEKDKMIKYPKK